MGQELVSVIMSVFNETETDLRKSINSILSQTYQNIEFIIINDNPSRDINRLVLSEIKSERVKIIHNEKNIGLVNSLNIAFKYSSGEYIARMDADDVSRLDRIEKQLEYLKNCKYDLVGSLIDLINENDDLIGEMVFPISDKYIRKSLKYGGCVAHPSWFAKRAVYESLDGYRLVPHCEDYDFLYRAINKGYKLGNVPEKCLNYRIRKNSISITNRNNQLVLRRFLSRNRKTIDQLTEKAINDYLLSKKFSKQINKLIKFEDIKTEIRKHNYLSVFRLIICSQFYFYLIERFIPKLYVYK